MVGFVDNLLNWNCNCLLTWEFFGFVTDGKSNLGGALFGSPANLFAFLICFSRAESLNKIKQI